MKFYKTIFLLLMMFSCFQMNAQTNNDPKPEIHYKNTIMSYPASFFASRLKLGYERNFATRKGLRINAMVGSSENAIFYGGDVQDLFEAGLEIQPRFYMQKNQATIKGFYMAPFAQYRYASFNTYSYTYYPDYREYFIKGSASAVNGGYIFGFQHIFPASFSFDVYAGGGISFPMGKYGYLDNSISVFHRGFIPNLGATIGFAF